MNRILSRNFKNMKDMFYGIFGIRVFSNGGFEFVDWGCEFVFLMIYLN